jgi:phosphoribosyl-ATP pyrophosphohydrolase/phosphoribosyl-AMP cyclohydrolase
MTPMSTTLKYEANGLIPAIVQDAITGRVLMLGWMNRESLALTQDNGEVWFYSRSRQELWHKGATSGNTLHVRELRTDCDSDVILIRAEPAGPTCHTGKESCFWQTLDGETAESVPAAGFIDELAGIIAQRRTAAPDSSYTARLFAKGRHKIAQKVGEEGLEVAMAGVAQDDDRLIDESADLIYHLLVLLNERNVSLRQVLDRLNDRHYSSNS